MNHMEPFVVINDFEECVVRLEAHFKLSNRFTHYFDWIASIFNPGNLTDQEYSKVLKVLKEHFIGKRDTREVQII